MATYNIQINAKDFAVENIFTTVTDCANVYQYVVTANNGESITMSVTGDYADAVYISNGVENTLSSPDTITFNNTLVIRFVIPNSGQSGYFNSAELYVTNADTSSTIDSYNFIVTREDDNIPCEAGAYDNSYISDVNLVGTNLVFDAEGDAFKNLVALGDTFIDNGGDSSQFIKGDGTLAEPETGWGNYSDTQYTSGSPFTIPANTDTVVPNNSASVLDPQKPNDVTSFVEVVTDATSGLSYDHSLITGREGDGILITIDCKVTPTNPSTTYIEFWFDIGGSIPPLYKRIVSFPKGNGVERPISFTVAGYTLDTWETNGATVYCRTNGTADIYDIRYLLTRTHKAI